jgi:hypothetical protein
MPYYPEQRHLLDMTVIRRQRFLPEDAVGRVEVRNGAVVNLRDVVARGLLPSRYVIVEGARYFNLKDPAELSDLMLVEVGETVEVKAPLAGRAGQRSKRLLSPVAGVVALVADGRILVQVEPEEITLEAGVDATVVGVENERGVIIETFGALVQGVWGNGKRSIGSLRPEPEDGIESLYGEDLDMQYRGAVVVTRRPLRSTGLMVLEAQGLGGIIAPSMDCDLIEESESAPGAVLLTEGFGSIRMSTTVFGMLSGLNGKQVLLDAAQPERWSARRPEAIINPTSRASARPPRPQANFPLNVNTQVRLTRSPNAGQMGRVVSLPKAPILLENGLRTLCAEIETLTGEKVVVPLANLEVFGR